MHKQKSLFLLLMLGFNSLFGQLSMRTNVATFDVIPLDSSGYYNGSDLKGGFWNGHFYFRSNYDSTWNSWSGFSVTNHGDTLKDDYTNEFSSITGSAINGTSNFAVCFAPGKIILEKKSKLEGFYITNTTYTYRTILNGSQFSKKFGGVSGNDSDWFRLKIYGYVGGMIQDSTEFYLADYRNLKGKKNYVINRWSWVDLSLLEAMDSLEFKLESSDTGQFGMNTPAYFAMDDFNAISPEKFDIYFNNYNFGDSSFFKDGNVWNGQNDTNGGFSYGGLYFENQYNTKWNTWSGWAVSRDYDTSKSGVDAQYVPIAGHGGMGSNENGVAVSYGRSVIRLPYRLGGWLWGWSDFSFSNSTFPYKAMKYGDGFSKKFGGASGLEEDYFKFYIIGYNDRNVAVDTFGYKFNQSGYFLADYRNGNKKINKSWANAKIPFNRGIVRLEFQLESSDTGRFGMNTPAYFCLDNLIFGIESVKRIKNRVLKVYPNPANTYIKVDLSRVKTFEIVNLSGKTLIKSNEYKDSGINIETLTPGLYFLKVYQDQKMYSARFIKK